MVVDLEVHIHKLLHMVMVTLVDLVEVVVVLVTVLGRHTPVIQLRDIALSQVEMVCQDKEILVDMEQHLIILTMVITTLLAAVEVQVVMVVILHALRGLVHSGHHIQTTQTGTQLVAMVVPVAVFSWNALKATEVLREGASLTSATLMVRVSVAA